MGSIRSRLVIGATILVSLLPGPAQALDKRQIGIIVNTLDPLSLAIGDYYAAKRWIVFQNVMRVSFEPRATLSREDFERIKAEVDAQTPPDVQAYVLTWAAPYRVGCMSITTAFAFGYDPAFCEPGCRPTRPSPYFNSRSRAPFTDHGMRPTMALAATSLHDARELIDRGVAAYATRPAGTAYLLSTTDGARNIRGSGYARAARTAKGKLRVQTLRQDELTGNDDVLFYFTGVARVEGLHTLRFLPGAIADHVTSAGGALTDAASGQTTALDWLEAGATGSYGTVVEPCNLPAKFPDPAIVMARYLAGETLIEAYWKSVRMPGQGIFVGEPLAAPFATRKGGS